MLNNRAREIGLILAVVAACGSPAAPSLPVTFTLAPGETGRADSVRVTFVRVVTDSRCPLNVMCVLAGDAEAEFSLSVGNANRVATLTLNEASTRALAFGGVIFEFQSLQPYPVSGQPPTNQRDYRATIALKSQ